MENIKTVQIVILCIGTNKLIGDSLGPIVGEKLNKLFRFRNDIKIYGNIHNTLNLKNAKNIFSQITSEYENPFIIVVDAALGKKKMIGNIVVNRGDIIIGNSLGNSIYCKSNINIKGVVGEYKDSVRENFETLKSIQMSTIMNISNKITNEIYKITNNNNV